MGYADEPMSFIRSTIKIGVRNSRRNESVKKKQEMDFLKSVIKLSYKNKKQRKVLLSLLFITYFL